MMNLFFLPFAYVVYRLQQWKRSTKKYFLSVILVNHTGWERQLTPTAVHSRVRDSDTRHLCPIYNVTWVMATGPVYK